MEMEKYEEATMIELHDRPLVLAVGGYNSVEFEAGDFQNGSESYEFDGAVLAELAGHFGVSHSSITLTMPDGRPDRRPLSSGLFPVVRRIVPVFGSRDSSYDITRLLGWVEGERLLHVRFFARDAEGGEFQRDFTYSGSFSVWWKTV